MNIPSRFTLNNWKERLDQFYAFDINHATNFDYSNMIVKAQELAPLLSSWDQNADQVIIDIYLDKGIESGNKSLTNYLQAIPTIAEEERVWQDFFSKIVLEPSWLNKNKLKTGAEFCRRAGVSSFIVLRDYCLMGSFQNPSIYQPLFYHGDLKENISRKIKDSIEFWVQITKENNLELGKQGLIQIFSKRMKNSFRRVNILRTTDYPTEKWGIPFNLWDQLMTNLNFSLMYLKGLRRIGIKASEEESNSLFHFWKYIGYLIGIPIELLPDNEEEAVDALNLWLITQPQLETDSKVLANILVNEPLSTNVSKDMFSRQLMREIHLYYNHYFLSTEVCKELNLPKTSIGRFALAHIWKTKQLENTIIDESSRYSAIKSGSQEQENIRKLFEDNKQ